LFETADVAFTNNIMLQANQRKMTFENG